MTTDNLSSSSYEAPPGIGAAPATRMMPRLVVNAMVGGMVWSAATTALALTDPGFKTPLVVAYGLAGFADGVIAGIAGPLVARWLRVPPTFDLPIGGVFATAIPLGVLGAAMGYSSPIGPGAGIPAQVVQAVFGMSCALGCGAVAGAVIGCIAMVPARSPLRIMDTLEVRRQSD